MMRILRYIQFMLLFCIFSGLGACGEDGAFDISNLPDSEGEGVQLSLNVSIANSRLGHKTKAEDFSYEHAENSYELIKTLRIIIVRQDNTVEHNSTLSAGAAVSTFDDLVFKVSTSQGTVAEGTLLRTEKKRIYLIANEASIVPNPSGDLDVAKYLADLKPGRYEKQESSEGNTGSGESGNSGEGENTPTQNLVYVKGDLFTPKAAEDLIIFNNWPSGSNGASPEYAVPYVDNEGAAKSYVPMTEFFEIDVTENLKTGVNNKKQVENLFVTRNLVKFRYSITASEGTSPFKVTAISFSSLMQEEFLFPNGTKYDPDKYVNATGNEREIIKFNTPGFEGKNMCPYIFRPGNFGFNGNAAAGTGTYQDKYEPQLYFCETKTNKLTDDEAPDFNVSIDVEFPFTEEIKDKDGNVVTVPATAHYDAKAPLNNLPYFLPRNTTVDIRMTLSNGVLSAEAVVLPYTAVSLNPEFGFSPPVTDRLVIAPSMTIPMNAKEADIYPTFESSVGNTIQNVYWVSSNPEVVLLGRHVDDEHSQQYIVPTDAVELPYYHSESNKETEPVRLFPQAVGSTYVTAYTQSGLVARCLVTVTEATTTE